MTWKNSFGEGFISGAIIAVAIISLVVSVYG